MRKNKYGTLCPHIAFGVDDQFDGPKRYFERIRIIDIEHPSETGTIIYCIATKKFCEKEKFAVDFAKCELIKKLKEKLLSRMGSLSDHPFFTSERNTMIFLKRHGLDGDAPKTNRELAEMYSLSVGTIIQIIETHQRCVKYEAEKDFKVKLLNLNPTSLNCLRSGDIKSIQDLTKKSEQDLLKIKNLGKKTLQKIKTALSEIGLELDKKTKQKENKLNMRIETAENRIYGLQEKIRKLLEQKKAYQEKK